MALKRYCTSQTTLEPKTLESNKSDLGCSQLTATGEPTGDLTPWDEVYFPFVPALHAADHLQGISITRLERAAPWIEERYTCDAHGILTVEMQYQMGHYARRYHLRGSAPRAPWQRGEQTPGSVRARRHTLAHHRGTHSSCTPSHFLAVCLLDVCLAPPCCGSAVWGRETVRMPERRCTPLPRENHA